MRGDKALTSLCPYTNCKHYALTLSLPHRTAMVVNESRTYNVVDTGDK
jgi:hypothetical protein